MKPTFLELRHLRTLLALKETGSVSMAAKRVYLTQSALSHQIKLMEEQFGLPLFERKSNPLRFTAAGDRLIRLANEILPKVVDAERELARVKHGDAGQLISSTLEFGRIGYCVWFPHRSGWIVIISSCRLGDCV